MEDQKTVGIGGKEGRLLGEENPFHGADAIGQIREGLAIEDREGAVSVDSVDGDERIDVHVPAKRGASSESDDVSLLIGGDRTQNNSVVLD